MIISRTPLRVSFVGGGTDLPSFYKEEFGQVLSTAIDKYVYIAIKRQLSIVEYKYRINWSTVEFKNKIEDIEHPIVRCALKLMEIDFPIEITTFADVPAGTGLGSSSSFTVGLLHALFALKGQRVTKNTLAKMAADIEVNKLKRHMGKQDHYAAAYGDLNVFSFHADENVVVDPVFYKAETKRTIENNLMLFYTGKQRDASHVLKDQVKNTPKKFQVLKDMRNFVPTLRSLLESDNSLDFGHILHKSWLLKKTLTNKISSQKIDQYYQLALQAGALGGKLLGAGGGGFLLLYVTPEKQQNVSNALTELHQIPFKFDKAGTRITYYDQTI